MKNLNSPRTIKEIDLQLNSFPDEITTWLYQRICITMYGSKSTNIMQTFLGEKRDHFPTHFINQDSLDAKMKEAI